MRLLAAARGQGGDGVDGAAADPLCREDAGRSRPGSLPPRRDRAGPTSRRVVPAGPTPATHATTAQSAAARAHPSAGRRTPRGGRQRAHQDRGGPLGTQVLHHRVEPPPSRGHPGRHPVEDIHLVGRRAARLGHGQRRASGRHAGAQERPCAAAPVVALVAGPSGGSGPRAWPPGGAPLLAGVNRRGRRPAPAD
jgi:hypothetical protein